VGHCLLVYDITDDKIRNKVAETCLDYGLERIQYSAFLGELNHNLQEEIMQKLGRQLGRNEGNIQLFPLCERDLRLRRQIIREGTTDGAKEG
jgi:CRISPR-associated protein Cas2